MIYHYKTNTIYCGDNLKVLEAFPDKSIDLIYIDPPFFSGKNYDQVFEDRFAVKAFKDTFDGHESSYIPFMRDRIYQMYRVLKLTGSFYLHCDYHANFSLRQICNEIFNGDKYSDKNFRNEIYWKRCHPKAISNGLANNTDTILYYSKSTKKYTFNKEFKPFKKATLKNFKHNDYNGKGVYRLIPVDAPKGKKFELGLGEKCPNRGYGFTKEKLLKMYDDDLLVIKKGIMPQQKHYLNETKGVPIDNFWDDIGHVVGNEKIGYDTQKPEKLLERIIKMSSNPNDIILDAFCGTGTTLEVAKRLDRQWIGIDVSPIGCTVAAKRLDYQLKYIQGMKYSTEQAKKMEWMDFQKYTIKLINGIPLTKKGADKGIDGWQNKNKFNQNIPVQVKKHKIELKDVKNFNTTIQSEKKKGGIMIGFEITKPSKIKITEIKRHTKIDIIFVNYVDIFDRELLLIKGVFKPTQREKYLVSEKYKTSLKGMLESKKEIKNE